MYGIIVFLVLCLYAGAAEGNYCNEISGTWQNQLGSNMTLFRMAGNQLTGEYSTAVESKRGAALVSSNITGTVTHLNDGALFAFTVLFNHGKSLATWVGQCMMCDGEEVLFTTWMLRSYHGKARDRWLSNNINQDTFKRMRRENQNNIPMHLRMMGPPEKSERSHSCEKKLNAGNNGFWASESEAVQFSNCYESGVLAGKHRDQPLHGRSGGGGSFTALGLVSSTDKGAKGWTGHIYDNLEEKERKVASSWLTHSFSDNCKNPRNLVQFGMDNYKYDVTYEDSAEENVPQPEGKGVLDYVFSWFS